MTFTRMCWMLCLAASAGCLGPVWTTAPPEPQPVRRTADRQAAPVRPVTAEEVTPANARVKAAALLEELDLEEQGSSAVPSKP